ncbi:hypothetical protein IWX90DRAFT_411601 [Phyllosticta citrichinensis]|uniref:Uncharacterized protein n=1 Tax=Phyllosticta citrichinensis TaxID=1130410 RepID=A0ABR1Y1E8_9PEZI
MSLPSGIGFSLHETEELAQWRWELPEATSSTVNINMEISKPAKLMMPWQSFVWFSLAIGVHPLDIDLEQRTWKLKRLSKPRPGVIKFSSPQTERIDKHGQGELCYDFFYLLRDRYNINSDDFHTGPIWLGEDAECPRKHPAAITWIFYLEGLSVSDQKKCISQGILEAQERSLLALYQLEKYDCLEAEIKELFSETPGTGSTPPVVYQILDFLRLDFKSSSYVKKSCEFLAAVQSILQHLMGGSPSELSAAVAELRSLKELKTCARPPNDSSEPPTLPRFIVHPEVRNHELFKELKKHFDPHNSEQFNDLRDFPSPKSRLMAHVMVALEDWRHLQTIPWGFPSEIRYKLITRSSHLEGQDCKD